MAERKNQGDKIWAMFLNWLVPGAGHWYLGDRARGLIYFVALTLTFWIGLAIGGAQSTVNVKTNTAWFFAQAFAGGYTILSMILGALPGALPSYSKTLDLSTIYTGVAGLLNIYVILDVTTRRESSAAPSDAAGAGKP